jgi:AcrR family transcriptional regulator
MAMVRTEGASRRQRKKAAVRSKIVATGVELFSVHGINDVTVEQIAEAADVGKGTIYNYFNTKEDIVVSFIVDIERTVQAQFDRFTSSKRRLDAILADFILSQFELKAPHHRFIRVFLAEMFSHTDHFLPYIVELQKFIDPPLEKLFHNLQDRGLIRADLLIPDLIMSFKTMHMGLTALWAIEGPPFHSTYDVLKAQMKMFSEGIRSTP